MFSNIIRQVPIHEILIDRESRQRTDLTFDSVLQLAVSIGRSQWISPILVDEETNYLIAGERRLLSVKALYGAVNGDYSGFTDQSFAREALSLVCTCMVDSWNQWSKIPAQLGKNFTPTDLVMYEFIENAHRQDLPWQDQARAIYDIHSKGLSQDPEWTAISTSNLIGVHRAVVTENLRLWRLVADEDAPEDVKSIVQESATLRSAAQALERYTSRRETGPEVSLSSRAIPRPKAETKLYTKPGPKPGATWTKEEPEAIEELSSNYQLLNEDFTKWAPFYEGEPFNFIHCDFPYGIKFNSGEYGQRGLNDIITCDYDDSPDTYWALLQCLKDNPHLIAPQAHIMFWFSQNLRRETEDFFVSMGGVVQPFLMIWHCGTNDGIVPDPQRYGRRTYETAMLITFGDRKIVSPRALSIEASREQQTRIHRSQKPTFMLRHFFGMFVDSASTVLDPTAGSGTSLLIAHELQAQRAIGLEVDPEIYSKAKDHISSIL